MLEQDIIFKKKTEFQFGYDNIELSLKCSNAGAMLKEGDKGLNFKSELSNK